jgi:hypothetical protein
MRPTAFYFSATPPLINQHRMLPRFHPDQNVIIAANVLNILLGLKPPCITKAQIAVPLLLAKQAQVPIHVIP